MLKPNEIKYLQKIPVKQKVVIKPYDPKILEITEMIIKRIKKVLPQAEIKSIGASALGISGQGDIDIYILENPNNFKNYSLLLRKLFGDQIPNSSLNEWRFKKDGHEVSIYLNDPNKQSVKDQLKVFEILSNNNRLLKEYEEIKIKAAKFSMREYQKRKYEFYNKILRNYSAISWLGKKVKVKIDRPWGSKHPDSRFKTIYPVNYGFIPGTYCEEDKEEIDAYVLGPTEPLAEFAGVVIAVIKRADGELKLVVTDGRDYSVEEIKKLTHFQEKYHQSKIII